MARKNTGSVFEKVWADGKTISYGAQVRAYGPLREGHVRDQQAGVEPQRAEIEAERIVQQIERGTWVPPRLEPREDRLEEAMAALGVRSTRRFRVFAKRWWRVQAARSG